MKNQPFFDINNKKLCKWCQKDISGTHTNRKFCLNKCKRNYFRMLVGFRAVYKKALKIANDYERFKNWYNPALQDALIDDLKYLFDFYNDFEYGAGVVSIPLIQIPLHVLLFHFRSTRCILIDNAFYPFLKEIILNSKYRGMLSVR